MTLLLVHMHQKRKIKEKADKKEGRYSDGHTENKQIRKNKVKQNCTFCDLLSEFSTVNTFLHFSWI